jgi:hypothetical protein
MTEKTRLAFREEGSREDDSWLTKEELSQCARADEAETFCSPVPTRHVSNGEYMPLPQSKAQKRVEARIQELADQASKKLNVNRRRFLRGAGGLAASFIAMNEVHGRHFKVDDDEMFEDSKGHGTRHGPPQDLFVFDDQLHVVRGTSETGGQTLRALAQGPSSGLPANPFNPEGLPDELGDPWSVWNPDLVGRPLSQVEFQLVQWIEDVYLKSQTTIGLLSNVTAFSVVAPTGEERGGLSVEETRPFEILTAEQTVAIREFVNSIAGSRRCYAHGLLYTGIGNVDYIQEQIDKYQPDSWKGYTISRAAKVDTDPNSPMQQWRLDDEDVAYPTYEVIARNFDRIKRERPGFNNICIHKGLVPETTPPDPRLGHPSDIPKAAKDWPDLNFCIYHSCIKPSFFMYEALQDIESGRLRNGVPDIEWTTEFAQLSEELPNVYAELGTTWASMIVTFPTVAAHVLGQLLKYMGPDRILFGSDSPWYGSPQWQIDAFWRFEIPEEIREKWGYPQLTKSAKRKILGLNNARLYEVDVKQHFNPVPEDYESLIPADLNQLLEYNGSTADNFSRVRDRYLAQGIQRNDTRYGWVRV